ncbi:MAG: HEAT repeat protein [Polyangiales bacterium]
MTLSVEERRVKVRDLQSIGSFGDPELAELFALLGDDDWRVRRDATDVALAMANKSWVARIVASILQPDSVGLRNACIELARAMGGVYSSHVAELVDDPECLSPLLFDGVGGGDGKIHEFLRSHAQSDDANISAAAIAAAARVGGEAAEDLLLSLLTDEDRYKVIGALDGLQVLGTCVSFETVANLLEDRIVWRGVVPLLGRTGDVRAVAALVRGLERPGDLAREATLGLAALDAALGTRAAVDVLNHQERERLRELAGTDEVGQAAVYLLIRARDAGAVQPLLAALAEERLTRKSIRSLREWGSAAAKVILAADSPHRGIAFELAAELSVGDPVVMEWVREALVGGVDDDERRVACAALRGLAIVGGGAECEAIMRVALSASTAVRAQAAATLSSISYRDQESVAEVCRTLRLEPGTAFLAPVVALVLGSDARERLVEGLSADDEALRAACAACLPQCGTNVVGHLAFAMCDESRDVRLSAAEALGCVVVGKDEAVVILKKSMSGQDDSLARVSAESLGELGDESAFETLLERAQARPSLALAALRSAFRLVPERVDIDELIQSGPPHLSLAAVELLEPFDARWVELLQHNLVAMRLRAARSLSVWEHGARVPLAQQLSVETDQEVIRVMTTALADAGGPP